MDEKDEKILEELKKDSSQTTSDIGKKTKIPITTVHNRIKKLEEEGVITGYTVELDHKKLGKDIAAYVLTNVIYTLPSGEKVTQESVARRIKALPETEEVSIVTGGTDLILKVRCANVDELNNFIIDRLRSIDGVDKTQTLVVLNSR